MRRPTPRSLSGAEAVRSLLQAEDLARDAERVRHDDGVRDALRVMCEVRGGALGVLGRVARGVLGSLGLCVHEARAWRVGRS